MSCRWGVKRLGAVACGLVVSSLLLCPNGSLAQLDQLRKAKPTSPPSALPAAPMVPVPAGAFRMGIDGLEGLEDERPAHDVWLEGYTIDQFEVTTMRYATFLTATGAAPPDGWDTVVLSRHGDKPVVGVSWEEARQFCEWEGKRLPTEAEWEKAARGTDGRRYPWGAAVPTEGRANFGIGARFSYDQVLFPVGGFPSGASPYGAQDMAGNVAEWTHDWYGTSYYEMSPPRTPLGPGEGQFKVVRGGSWSDLPKYLLTYGRFKLPPETRNSFTGFRCAK